MLGKADTTSLVRTTVSDMREAARQIMKIDCTISDEQLNELERAYLMLADAIELKRLANEAGRS